MVSIIKFKVLDNNQIHFHFNDSTEKTINFAPFIGEDKISNPLSDPKFFKNVELYENGRGIYWPNGYDFCPDFLRHYLPEEKSELAQRS